MCCSHTQNAIRAVQSLGTCVFVNLLHGDHTGLPARPASESESCPNTDVWFSSTYNIVRASMRAGTTLQDSFSLPVIQYQGHRNLSILTTTSTTKLCVKVVNLSMNLYICLTDSRVFACKCILLMHWGLRPIPIGTLGLTCNSVYCRDTSRNTSRLSWLWTCYATWGCKLSRRWNRDCKGEPSVCEWILFSLWSSSPGFLVNADILGLNRHMWRACMLTYNSMLTCISISAET